MLSFFKNYILFPGARFLFEWLGDRPWVAGILILLIIGAVIRWGLPWVIGFYKVFGWQGIALVAAAFLSVGIYGAGWRAHRASVMSGVDTENPNFDLGKKQPLPKPRAKAKRKPASEAPMSTWDKIKNGIPLN